VVSSISGLQNCHFHVMLVSFSRLYTGSGFILEEIERGGTINVQENFPQAF
jgi:hypothetical protein